MRSAISLAVLLGSLSACSGAFNGKDQNPEGQDGGGEGGTTAEPTPEQIDDDGDGLSEEDGDCDDTNADISPDASEIPYDGIDNDCDESTPDDDLDGDGSLGADDCDDENGDMSPELSEEPYDGLDNDCDEDTPDDDLDGDGAGIADDCDDDDDEIGPHIDEVPYDGLDNDCDEDTPDDDLDADGFLSADDCNDEDPLVYPGADEDYTNGVDDDCDEFIDERFDYVTVDSSCDCGAPNAIATDSAGQVWLAYRDNDLGEIKYDMRTPAGRWTGATTVSTTSGYDAGLYMDAEVDKADYFNLAYTSEDLTYGTMQLDYQYASPSGSWSGAYEVDGPSSTGSYYVGYFVDIAMDSGNLPSFAYYDAYYNYPYLTDYTSLGVGVTVQADYLATTTTDYQGIYTALAIDSEDYAHVAYYDQSSPYGFGWSPENQYSTFDLSLSDSCFTATIGDDGIYNSLAVKSDDTVCIAYQDASSSDLMYACNTGSCSGWATQTVASTGAVGEYAGLAFNSKDEPYIAYYDTSNRRLMMAHNDGTGFTTFVVDESSSVGTYADIAIDAFDNVHVSYYDADKKGLKYAIGR